MVTFCSHVQTTARFACITLTIVQDLESSMSKKPSNLVMSLKTLKYLLAAGTTFGFCIFNVMNGDEIAKIVIPVPNI